MLRFGPAPHPHALLATSRFLADEISVRLAHRHAELESLPYGLHATHEAKIVRAWYKASFDELTGFYDDLAGHWAHADRAPDWTRPWWQRLLRSTAAATKNKYEQLQDQQGHEIAVPRGLAVTSALAERSSSESPPPLLPTYSPADSSLLLHNERYYNTQNDPPLPPHMLSAVPYYNKKFTTLLSGIVDRHNPVVVTVSQNLPRLLPSSHPQHHPEVQAFLNRFHANRVGVRILIGHHLALSNPQSRRFPNHIGIVCTQTDTIAVAQEAAEDAAEICEQNFDGVAPPVNIVVNSDTANSSCELVYIPSHMHHILFELLKNSMRATMMKYYPGSSGAEGAGAEGDRNGSTTTSTLPSSSSSSSSSSSASSFSSASSSSSAPISPPPVTITITPTPTQITIRVSDTGCGIPRAQLANVMTYAYTTASGGKAANQQQPPHFTGSELEAPMAGFGYGLPLAKLYARYFKGDLAISSVYGMGTDVDLVLRRDWATMSEQVSM
ncbi:hypothetical protein HDU87_004408 [Geranomyces variabilis]|uniref:Protein-serine/threonine kinase n=1 Tax=Geranomyces variabilis TaxID=109894 RepID=A0AAD5XM19_9FUNG|nr:hypothetical protein HDU87_004408 [Geranomyces variabilis]